MAHGGRLLSNTHGRVGCGQEGVSVGGGGLGGGGGILVGAGRLTGEIPGTIPK